MSLTVWPAVVCKETFVNVAEVESPDVNVLVLRPRHQQCAVSRHVHTQYRQLVPVQREEKLKDNAMHRGNWLTITNYLQFKALTFYIQVLNLCQSIDTKTIIINQFKLRLTLSVSAKKTLTVESMRETARNLWSALSHANRRSEQKEYM